jgi:hypothetical protein
MRGTIVETRSLHTGNDDTTGGSDKICRIYFQLESSFVIQTIVRPSVLLFRLQSNIVTTTTKNKSNKGHSSKMVEYDDTIFLL